MSDESPTLELLLERINCLTNAVEKLVTNNATASAVPKTPSKPFSLDKKTRKEDIVQYMKESENLLKPLLKPLLRKYRLSRFVGKKFDTIAAEFGKQIKFESGGGEKQRDEIVQMIIEKMKIEKPFLEEMKKTKIFDLIKVVKKAENKKSKAEKAGKTYVAKNETNAAKGFLSAFFIRAFSQGGYRVSASITDGVSLAISAFKKKSVVFLVVKVKAFDAIQVDGELERFKHFDLENESHRSWCSTQLAMCFPTNYNVSTYSDLSPYLQHLASALASEKCKELIKIASDRKDEQVNEDEMFQFSLSLDNSFPLEDLDENESDNESDNEENNEEESNHNESVPATVELSKSKKRSARLSTRSSTSTKKIKKSNKKAQKDNNDNDSNEFVNGNGDF